VSVRAPQRVDWIDRQLLAGTDLRAAHAYLDVLRARHLRGAHATWGVALGLSVRDVGGGVFEVGEGLAYDALGRELLVPRPIQVAASVASGRRTIALRSVGDRCVPQAVAHVVNDDRELRAGLDVPVAVVDAAGTIESETRAHVRTLAPARVASGSVPVAGAGITGSPLAFKAKIETGNAGFVGTPAYVVQAQDAARSTPAGAFGPLLAVSGATPVEFTLEARYVFRSVADYKKALEQTSGGGALPFAVDWLGVEAPGPCGVLPAPAPDCPCLV
jgi:hypothetical protein